MNLVIFRENAPLAHWIVLKETDNTTFDGQYQRFYTRFAECGSYEDALAIVKSMNLTEPSTLT